MDQAKNGRKVFKVQPIAVGVEARAEAFRGGGGYEKGVIRTGKKVYRPPLPSTYKETELSERLSYGM